MPIGDCQVCRNLLLDAGRAIVAHLQAVSRLEESVIESPGKNIASIEAAALESGLTRENAVRAYEEHVATHTAKVRTVASER